MIQRIDMPSLGLLAWYHSLGRNEHVRIDEIAAASSDDDSPPAEEDKDPC